MNYLGLRRFDEAAHSFRSSLDLNGDRPGVMVRLGAPSRCLASQTILLGWPRKSVTLGARRSALWKIGCPTPILA
jgi:hypothetical protein